MLLGGFATVSRDKAIEIRGITKRKERNITKSNYGCVRTRKGPQFLNLSVTTMTKGADHMQLKKKPKKEKDDIGVGPRYKRNGVKILDTCNKEMASHRKKEGTGANKKKKKKKKKKTKKKNKTTKPFTVNRKEYSREREKKWNQQGHGLYGMVIKSSA